MEAPPETGTRGASFRHPYETKESSVRLMTQTLSATGRPSRRARSLVTVLAIAALGVLGLTAPSAQAATTLTFREVTTSVTFLPASGPDPRGAGSVFISEGDLVQNGQRVGTVYVNCLTTRKVGADYYGYCRETLTVTGKGSIFAEGEINESALERFVPQTIAVTGGAGAYAGRTGSLRIQQVVFPTEFVLTVTLR
jgi:hypothetical protein